MNKKILLIIFMLQAFIFNLTNVITPQYLDSLLLEKYMFGYFVALFSLGMLLSSPIWGELGDRYGRKKFVVIGIIIYGLSQLGFYYSTSIPLIFMLRVTSGIGVGAPVTLLLSYLVSNSERGSRTKNLSYRLAFITIGSTVSYKVSGILGLTYTKELFLFQSVLSIIFVLLVVLGVQDKKPHCVVPKQFHLFNSLANIKKLNRSFIVYLFSITLTTMTFTNIDKFIDIYIIDLGFDSSVLGNIKMVIGLVFIVTNFLVIPRIKEYLGRIYILQSLQVIMAVVVLTTFMYSNIILMLYTVFLFFAAGKAIFTTSEQFYLSRQVPKEELGLFVGLRQSFVCLGMILGPVVGGHLYSANTINIFVFSVICLLISSLLLSYIDMAYNVNPSRAK